MRAFSAICSVLSPLPGHSAHRALMSAAAGRTATSFSRSGCPSEVCFEYPHSLLSLMLQPPCALRGTRPQAQAGTLGYPGLYSPGVVAVRCRDESRRIAPRDVSDRIARFLAHAPAACLYVSQARRHLRSITMLPLEYSRDEAAQLGEQGGFPPTLRFARKPRHTLR